MAYTFDYLGGEFSAAHFRNAIDLTESSAPDGWICLAFSNHDVVRHISRWSTHGQQEEFTRLACTMLLSMRGSVCLYQGEELGLTEAELAFEDLVDPYGIEFWPQFKGRDGCRTPMVWQTQIQMGGFTTATPRLAAGAGRSHDQGRRPAGRRSRVGARALSGDARLPQGPSGADPRQRSRRSTRPRACLAFMREGAGERLYCVFNMSEKPVAVNVPAGFDLQPSGAPGIEAEPAQGALSLAPFGAYIGILR